MDKDCLIIDLNNIEEGDIEELNSMLTDQGHRTTRKILKFKEVSNK